MKETISDYIGRIKKMWGEYANDHYSKYGVRIAMPNPDQDRLFEMAMRINQEVRYFKIDPSDSAALFGLAKWVYIHERLGITEDNALRY